jgi:cupin 2 domain-containing protein
MILQGTAGLLFDGDEEAVVLKPGDYLNIPAHKKHRVLWTDKTEKTIWLAIHYR